MKRIIISLFVVFLIVSVLYVIYRSAQSFIEGEVRDMKGLDNGSDVSQESSSFDSDDTTNSSNPKGRKSYVNDSADGSIAIGDLNLPFYFEDETIPIALKKAIETDVELAFSTMKTHRYDELFVNSSKQQWITFQGGVDQAPEIIRSEFGAVERINGVDYLRISKTLSSAYSEAFDIAVMHELDLADLSSSIELLNNLDPEQVKIGDDVLEIVSSKVLSAEIRTHVVKAITATELRKSSLLDIGVREVNGEEVLSAKVYAIEPASGSSTAFLFILEKGKWKVIIEEPGT